MQRETRLSSFSSSPVLLASTVRPLQQAWLLQNIRDPWKLSCVAVCQSSPAWLVYLLHSRTWKNVRKLLQIEEIPFPLTFYTHGVTSRKKWRRSRSAKINTKWERNPTKCMLIVLDNVTIFRVIVGVRVNFWCVSNRKILVDLTRLLSNLAGRLKLSFTFAVSPTT